MALSALISLDGYDLTDDGRVFDVNLDERKVDNELADGSLRRYSKARKNKFNMQWSWLPDISTFTSDRKHARNQIKSLATAGGSHTLVVRTNGGGTETYTVLVDSYSEKLIRRDGGTGVFLYDVSLSLVEV